MKSFLYCLLAFTLLISSCHRKTVSAKSSNNNKVKPLLSEKEAAGDASVVAPPAAPLATKPVIIVDARGNFAVIPKHCLQMRQKKF